MVLGKSPIRTRSHQPAPRARASAGARALCLAVLTLSVACERKPAQGTSGPGPSDNAPPTPAARAEADLFAFGRVLGTIAPCGCTTDPLGGLQYAFGYIEANSTAGARAVIEPGSFLFPAHDGPEAPKDPADWAQAEHRADALAARFAALGPDYVAGLGPSDLWSPQGASALERWKLPRVSANPPADLKNTPGHTIIPLKIGSAEARLGTTAAVISGREGPAPKFGEAKAAVTQALAAMRSAGATHTLVSLQGTRAEVETFVRDVKGIDVAVVAYVEGVDRARLGAPMTRIGDTFVIEPGEQLQTISHVTLKVAEGVKTLPPVSQWGLQQPQAVRDADLKRARERLGKFEGQAGADPAFIAQLKAEVKRLEAAPETPDQPVLAIFEQVKVTCHGTKDAKAVKALSAYDEWVALTNKKRFTGVTPPAPAKGEASYVGIEECEMCHDEAVEFWRTTRHAGAFATLEMDNKHHDVTCVGCHVTGFREPGGSEVVENAGLRDVQCEQCHGPGSIHAEEPERDGKPYAIELHAPESVCLGCHTPEHSDTFDYTPYLRDVLGEGHGAAARARIGDGPTGRELRAAGFAKAGGSCKKM